MKEYTASFHNLFFMFASRDDWLYALAHILVRGKRKNRRGRKGEVKGGERKGGGREEGEKGRGSGRGSGRGGGSGRGRRGGGEKGGKKTVSASLWDTRTYIHT